jgi:hypothetical protein
MFAIKSPLKYFPVSVGDYTLAYSEELNEFVLYEKNHAWMGYDQNTFWQSSEFYIEIQKAYGVCITTGLGLGILQAHLCQKKEVSKVIVYEKSNDVVEIFNEIVKFNNFDISKLEIRTGDADTISNQKCNCLFADHFDNEAESHIINVVKNLSYNNTADIVWYWPAGNHFVKYANKQNRPYDKETYELWKNLVGIKNLPTEFPENIYSYFAELQRIYTNDTLKGKLRLDIESSIMRKNMLNHSKKLRK